MVAKGQKYRRADGSLWTVTDRDRNADKIGRGFWLLGQDKAGGVESVYEHHLATAAEWKRVE
jgi:hypothetical protein